MAKQKVQASVITMATELKQAFLEREREVNVLMTAALAREHVVLLGIAGTGKSALLRAFGERLGGARMYETLLNKSSVPEQLLGPWKLSALEQDRFERNTDGTLLDCEMAFVDEVFKGSAMIQNLMLPIMNERQCRNGNVMMKLPLRLLVAASNEMPESGQGLEAAWDRYLLREMVQPIASEANRFVLLERAAQGPVVGAPQTRLTLQQWDEACEEVTHVELDKAVINTILTVRREGEKEGMVYGDRRWVKAVRILQAYAYLHGGTAVEEDHLEVLESVLWNTPEQRPQVNKLLAKHVAPQVSQARALADAALAEANKLTATNNSDSKYKAMTVLKTAGEKIHALVQQTRKGSRSNVRCREIWREVGAQFNAVQSSIREQFSGAFEAEAESAS